jgi:3',5'-nucleoside bisphosphate phosphatase
VLEVVDYYLGSALTVGFDELCADAAARGAVVIPAHVDRPMFSVSSQLGFLPPVPYDAIESMREPSPELTGAHTAISGSDAHYPEQVCSRPFTVELPDGALSERGSDLLEILRHALRAGRVGPSWAAARGRSR